MSSVYYCGTRVEILNVNIFVTSAIMVEDKCNICLSLYHLSKSKATGRGRCQLLPTEETGGL